MIDHNKDGIDHINIYSKGRTALGRFLSNFAQAEIETEDGEFASIEGYWYWLLCHPGTNPDCKECDGEGVTALDTGPQTYFGPCNVCSRDTLRTLFGNDAKKFGRALRQAQGLSSDEVTSEDFRRKIKAAIKFKIDNHPRFKAELAKCSLPFEHYYVFYGKIKEPSEHRWVIDYIDELRKEYGAPNGQVPALQTR